MVGATRGLQRLGGIGLAAGGGLFLLAGVLEVLAGAPPADGAQILTWMAAQRLPLAFVSEATFLAVVAAIPGVAALQRALAGEHPGKVALGCGSMALAGAILTAALVAHGRLVFPVYGLRVSSPATAELVVSLYAGGLHAAELLLAVGTAVLGLAMWRGPFGKTLSSLGVATGALQITASYPWAISPAILLTCRAAFASWLVAVGARLARRVQTT